MARVARKNGCTMNEAAMLLEGLTEPQKQAVQHMEGALLVLAGPGSGKTTVVTRRIAHLILRGVRPWRILALTFTNKAAREMQNRVNALLARTNIEGKGLTVATFHSFCARLLRRYAKEAGLSPNFSIYDSADQNAAIKKALEDARIDSKNFSPGMVASVISNAKNALQSAAEFGAQANDFVSKTVARVYAAYEQILKTAAAVDFDDLLLLTAKLLRDNEAVRMQLQHRFQFLLIDEYQDTNHAQFMIAHTLAAAHGNICVVGDPDQSIYAWRGADIGNILEFEQQYPSAAVVPLGQNFRSTAHIVATAAKLIENNKRRKHKRLHTELGEGVKPLMKVCADEHDEAREIAELLREEHEKNTTWREMAVLYRINALSRVLEEELRAAQIPYTIARGTAFYDRKEVKDALAYLRLIANESDEVSLRRIVNVPPRGIGNTTLNAVELFAVNNQVSLMDAMRRAGEIMSLSARAQTAIRKFVEMVDGWRKQCETDGLPEVEVGGLQFESGSAAEEHEGEVELRTLVEMVIRESGLETMFASSKADEDRERLENLGELVSATAPSQRRTTEPDSSDETPPTDDVNERARKAMTAAGYAEMAVFDSVWEGLEEESGEELESAAVESTGLMKKLRDFLESVALVSDADAIDPENGAVTLMTLHAAKGLEFEVVCLAGLEEGILPHTRAFNSDAELEEERRLCFVGLTRAKRRLLLTRAVMRTQRGVPERMIGSQFVRELPRENVEFDEREDPAWGMRTDDDGADGQNEWGRSGAYQRRSPRTKVEASPARTYRPPVRESGGGLEEDYPVGCMVRHPMFGLGRVESFTPRPAGAAVRVAFTRVGSKTLILGYAKLERV
ncbi:MAG TPA: UvrD-helicase domain-containing protein [Phycisphaerales bacterium]|nr:UvrD-helicase domain-containing protein [Phycisphaerales bacterium]